MGRIFIFSFLILFGFSALVTAGTPAVEKETKDTLVTARDTTDVDTGTAGEPEEISHKYIVYYFHGTRRCATCKKIEAYSEEAVSGGFEQRLKDGSLEWRVVNTDEEANRHYMKDYELFTKSLVISEVKDGKERRWKNLSKIWELVNDKDEFTGYVQSEITAFMNEE